MRGKAKADKQDKLASLKNGLDELQHDHDKVFRAMYSRQDYGELPDKLLQVTELKEKLYSVMVYSCPYTNNAIEQLLRQVRASVSASAGGVVVDL